jgi:hypothetical protein
MFCAEMVPDQPQFPETSRLNDKLNRIAFITTISPISRSDRDTPTFTVRLPVNTPVSLGHPSQKTSGSSQRVDEAVIEALAEAGAARRPFA